MTAIEAFIEADRTDALQAGSRAEALRRGLCSPGVLPESLELLQVRAEDWYHALKPQDYHQAWLVDQVAVISVRIDRCARVERRLRDRASLRAEVAWDVDRAREAEALGSRLARSPGEVAARLRETPQGCDWLSRRWTLLERAASSPGGWTPEQRSLALDLLGTPAEFRAGIVDVDVDGDGDPAATARAQLEGLAESRATAAGLDEVDRRLVEADLFDDPSAEIRRHRRHEATLHNRLRWFLSRFEYRSPHRRPHPDLKPEFVDPAIGPAPEAGSAPGPAPATAPEAEARPSDPPHAPFDLEPEECPPPGEEPDFPAILRSRRSRRAEASEARREAKRRRVERLRA